MASGKDDKDSNSPSKEGKEQLRIKIEELQLGVWHVKIASDTAFGIQKQWDDVRAALPLYWRLMKDIFNVSPVLFTVFTACQLLHGIEDSLLMHLSNRLLRNVEAGVGSGRVDSSKILTDVAIRLLCTIFFAFVNWYSARVLELLQSRVTRHFALVLMKAKLNLDMPTSQEAASKQEASAQSAWNALQTILRFSTDVLRAGSHILLIAHISRWTGGPVYTLLCDENLEKLAGEKFRQDIISGALGSWIAKEYHKSYSQLAGVPDSHPYQLYNEGSAFPDVMTRVLGDAPMLFCALRAIQDPAKFSVTSLAILQQSSTSLKFSLSMVLLTTQRFRKSVTSVKSIYASTTVVNSMAAGNTPYPRVEEKHAELAGSKGMGFELRDVSFTYPGAQATTPALKNVNLIIKPGQLVVIVGTNGSGKSTLIRLLSRLYDPSSGQVLIDGLPSASYRIDDLHTATTLLSQDSLLYPLSVGENIGLGYPERVDDEDMIKEAAEKGGALEVVQKLKSGFDTELDPTIETFQIGLYGNKTHPLYEEMEKVRKPSDVSGGEKQRIVAARSFMRFQSGKVKFVAVDEPTSALDAEAELRLFRNLLAVREGKTMVFVTHRFGHLTKHADLILCMKEGSIVEMGSHEELIQKKGEYTHLYEIQASAFSDTTTTIPPRSST